MEQYAFESLWTLSNLFAHLEQLLCFQSYIIHFKRFCRDFSFSVCWLFSVFVRGTWYVLIFSWINLILVLNHGGSLSSHAINSWGIKLLRIFKTVLLRLRPHPHFCFRKLFPIWTDCSSDKIIIRMFIVPNLTSIRRGIMDFKIKFCLNNLI